MSKPRPTNASSADWHGLISLSRIFFVIISVLGLAWIGGVLFGGLDYVDLARKFLDQHPTFKIFPFPEFYTVVFNPKSWRYLIAPLGALFATFLGAAYYIKDIYALVRLRDAVHYIVTSMFALLYPKINVESGTAQIIKGKTNLLDAIGGPGFCTIQPGNVVLFRKLRGPSNITLSAAYFLDPFERIDHIANLDDQHGSKSGIGAITSDGIKITLKDVHFRYRIFPEIMNTQPIRRSPTDPYPFDDKALWSMAYNLVVDDRGLETWRDAVARVIVGGIADFISENSVDFLTAPRGKNQDPRSEIRNRLFYGGPRYGLRTLGAELLWVDIGHFSIDEDAIDEIRQNLWAASWLGDARVTRASGLGQLAAYKELGRAEAQARMIAAIADAIRTEDPEHEAESLRRIILVKTAEILETQLDESKRILGEHK
jgi:hypothetical protein